jgi:1,2-dihydroxy-3-keto-5-methylthiopentene dioxygenase
MVKLNAYVLDRPDEKVSMAELSALGVVAWQLDPTKHESDPTLDTICKERGYTYRDYVNSAKIPNLADKLDNFKVEHLHDDEEIRYFVDGSGYFDLRNKNEDYVRIHLVAGDMITLPAGIFHRFLPDETMKFCEFLLRTFLARSRRSLKKKKLHSTRC